MTYLPVEQLMVFPQLSMLDTENNGITRVAPSVSQLTWLEALYLNNNALRALPSTMTALTRLEQ